MKTQDDAGFHFAFVVRRLVFRISFTNHCEHSPIHACTRLNYMRNNPFLRFLIEVVK